MVTSLFFFFNDTATTEIYTLSLHDALPICLAARGLSVSPPRPGPACGGPAWREPRPFHRAARRDRKSTRLNSSHLVISYAVFCLKKNNSNQNLATNVHMLDTFNSLHYDVST